MSDEAAEAGGASDARQALLNRVIDHLSKSGSHDLTLRGIGTAIGTSHRMLIYHFDSLDGLMAAVVREVEERQRRALDDFTADADVGLAQVADAFWQRLRAPELRPLERLFFQLYGRALLTQQDAPCEDLVVPWLARSEAVLVERGFPPDTARALSRLGLAVTRGLLLDLLATGDEQGVDAAMHLYYQQLDAIEAAAVHRIDQTSISSP